jgi:hypothetical protein
MNTVLCMKYNFGYIGLSYKGSKSKKSRSKIHNLFRITICFYNNFMNYVSAEK